MRRFTVATMVFWVLSMSQPPHGLAKFDCFNPNISGLELAGFDVGETPIEFELDKPAFVDGTLTKRAFMVRIESVRGGSLADRVGIKVGDYLIQARGLYIKGRFHREQINNLLRTNMKAITLVIARPGVGTMSAKIPRPKPICESYQALATKLDDIKDNIKLSSYQINSQSSISSSWDTHITTPALRAEQVPTFPSCPEELQEDLKSLCAQTTKQIYSLQERIPSLELALAHATELSQRDSSALELRKGDIKEEINRLLPQLEAARWDEPAYQGYLKKVNEIERQWQDHKGDFIQRQSEFVRAAKTYEEQAKAWGFDLKAIHDQLAKIETTKQQLARKVNDEKQKQENVVAAQRLETLLAKYQAEDLTVSTQHTISLVKNPYAYKGKNVFVSGFYLQHIGQNQALVDVMPFFSQIGNIIQIDTSRNFALEKKTVKCVVEVLGMTTILQGGIQRDVSHTKEVECLP